MSALRPKIVIALMQNEELFSSLGNADAALPKFMELSGLNPEMSGEVKRHFKYFYNQVFSRGGQGRERVQAMYQDYVSRGLTLQGRNPEDNTLTIGGIAGIEIRTFSTAGMDLNQEMFKRYITNSEVDDIFSDDGGPMAGTTNVIVGGPGVGKTTVCLGIVKQIKEFNPGVRIGIVSSEMEQEDLIYEAYRKPWMNDLEFILTSEYEENLKDVMTAIFDQGYDVILLDSLQDIVDKLKDFCGMTSSAAENWMLLKMKKCKGGQNRTGVHTCFLIIQQQTKGGNFAGSNKIKHGVTAMFELHREGSGDRYMKPTKNRRCGQHVGKKLYYYLGANNHVMFDGERWEREMSRGEEDRSFNTSGVPNTAATEIAAQLSDIDPQLVDIVQRQHFVAQMSPLIERFYEPVELDATSGAWIMHPTQNGIEQGFNPIFANTRDAARYSAAEMIQVTMRPSSLQDPTTDPENSTSETHDVAVEEEQEGQSDSNTDTAADTAAAA